MTATIPAPSATQKTYAFRPMTGDEYIESLRDGREIWLHGERSRTSPPTRRSATRFG